MPKKTRVGAPLIKGPSQGPSLVDERVDPDARASSSNGPFQGHSSSEERAESDVSFVMGDGLARKRASTSFFAPGCFDSDTETEGTTAAKSNTARRGRRKADKAAPSYYRRGSAGDALEEVLLNRQFGGGRAAAVPGNVAVGTGSDTDVATRVGDASELNAQELRAQAGEKIACILEVAKKSGNLKGEFVARLKGSAAGLREVVDALADRSEADETRRLRAENSRLRLQTQALAAEVKSLRRGFTEAKSEAAAATTAAAVAAAAGPQAAPAIAQVGDMVEELKRSLTITFGEMLNARMDGIRERLLPAPILRPPLRADAKRAAVAAVTPKATLQQAPGTAPRAGKRAAPVVPVAGPSREAAPVVVSQVSPGETWAKVAGKGKGKGKKSSPPSAPAIAPVARVATAAAPKSSSLVALKAPKSAAVVVSLKPEAAAKGVTYGAVLQRAKDSISLQELGIDRVQFRQTATGARMLEVSGSQSEEKADRLAERLRGVLSEVASVSRPVKCTDLRVTGLDDTATKERVAAAAAEAGRCDVRLVRAGEIRSGPGGAGSTLVSCPISAAKVLLEKGRLMVGWSSARVVALGERPMRCFKCMGLGHTRPQCPASADRGDLCFRCGGTGHKAATCGRAVPRCAICAESGRPSGHVMGGRNCIPPKTKGKAVGARTAPTASSQAAPEAARQAVSEEVEMAD